MNSKFIPAIAVMFLLILVAAIQSSAQNTSPYWSLAGNSTATTTSKFGTTNAIPLRFVTNNIDRLSITAGGNIGIGVASPTDKLHINTPAGINPFRLQVNGVNTFVAHGNGGVSIGSGSTPSPNGLYVAGRVGIGTASPQALLHLPSSGKLTLTTTDNFLLGSINSNNLAFDYNKIQARNNGQANTLQLNPGGGAMTLGNVTGTSNPGMYIGTDGAAAIGGQRTQPGYSFTVNPNHGGGIFLYQSYPKMDILLRAENAGLGAAISASNFSGSNPWPAISGTTLAANQSILAINHGGTTGSSGIRGIHEGSGYGVHGSSVYGLGVFAYSDNGFGLYASSGSSYYSAHFARNIYVNGAVYTGSDQKLKHNVQDLKGAMDLLNKLHPKSYSYRQDGPYNLMKLPEGTRYGLIAQELEKVLPQLVKETKFESAWETRNGGQDTARSAPSPVKNEVTTFKAVNYTELIPIMIKGMQEQQEKIEELERQLRELKDDKRVATSMNQDRNKNKNNDFLSQNAPNPASGSTRISYNIKTGGNAQLVLNDNSGKTIRTIQLAKAGVVELQTLGLGSGVYNYSLLVNGKVIETKRMEVLR